MNKMTDSDLWKKKFKRVDVKTRKGLDKDEVNIESDASVDLTMEGVIRKDQVETIDVTVNTVKDEEPSRGQFDLHPQ